jgi:hypothetical protein
MLVPDIFVKVNFYSTGEGGRKLPTDSKMFGSIFTINDSKHDCRLLLENIGAIKPGETKSGVPIKFLCPELVIPKLKKGVKFYLWDMRNIAEGEVEQVLIKA